jgi:hypothetical protein
MSKLRHLLHSVLAIGLVLVGMALMGFCTTARAEPLVLGLHTASLHVPAKQYLRDLTPGIYARQGIWQGGVYRNSYGRTSVYGGAVLPIGSVDLMLGLATGYDKRCSEQTHVTTKTVVTPNGTVTLTSRSTTLDCKGWSRHRVAPLAALSWAPPVEVLTARPRLSFMPRIGDTSSLVHLSLEREFSF